MTADSLAQLRTDLVTGIERRRRRVRRRWRVTLAAFTAALALVGSLAMLGSPERSADALAITQGSNTVELHIQDAAAGAARMNAELREAGIDAEVRLVPATQDRVGTWLAAQGKGPGVEISVDKAAAREEIDRRVRENRLLDVRIEPDIARIPHGFRGHVILFAGREARPGERVEFGGGERGPVER